VDLSNLMHLRTTLKHAAQERGISFSYMPIFIKVKAVFNVLLYFAIVYVFVIVTVICAVLIV